MPSSDPDPLIRSLQYASRGYIPILGWGEVNHENLCGYIPILGGGEVDHENLCIRKRSLYCSTALTLPSNTIETPLRSMWNELC